MATVAPTNLHPLAEMADNFWKIDPELVLHPPHEYAIYRLAMSAFFNASHQVAFKDSPGNLHRHSFHLKVSASSSSLGADNSLVPYETLRSLLAQIVQAYEGTILNDLPPFHELQPTIEALAGVITQQVQRLACGLPVKIIEVAVMESPTQGVSVQLFNG
jgi:6-pyruvoyltetrahydropterin/6-carboxytetrahydropterin synthase